MDFLIEGSHVDRKLRIYQSTHKTQQVRYAFILDTLICLTDRLKRHIFTREIQNHQMEKNE